ncbi:MAG: MBL fold metallo-hydrolase [Eubacteriales bacterium]
MKLYIAGGVGEHGRNCFYAESENVRFLVDCGKMADTPDDPYPRLTKEQIEGLHAVFLTHSHADHTGALPWLCKNGFHGSVVATEETLGQLPMAFSQAVSLQSLCPGGMGTFRSLFIHWGRSGHCAGSVWYRFSAGEKSILFSGDYTENTQIYSCDPIRKQTADLAVLDCAYGNIATTYSSACEYLAERVKELLSAHGLLLFPVPKYGRGPELLKLLGDYISNADFFADDLFLENLSEQKTGGFWYRPVCIRRTALPYSGQHKGIVFVSDPQLRTEKSQQVAEDVLKHGGKAVMTGTTERGSYSETLLRRGCMEKLHYPVHLSYSQLQQLAEQNNFKRIIPYHSAEFSLPRTFRI